MEGVIRWPEELEASYREHGYWDDVSLSERFDQWVAQYGDRAALAYEGRDISLLSCVFCTIMPAS